MLQHAVNLCRLATPVHQGQSACNKKCVCKWGSYFYCFHYFAGSAISPHPTHFLILLLSCLFENTIIFIIYISSYFCLHVPNVFLKFIPKCRRHAIQWLLPFLFFSFLFYSFHVLSIPPGLPQSYTPDLNKRCISEVQSSLLFFSRCLIYYAKI